MRKKILKIILALIIIFSPLIDLFIVPVMAIPSAIVASFFISGPKCDGKLFCELGGYFDFVVILGLIGGIIITLFLLHAVNNRLRFSAMFYKYLRIGVVAYHFTAYIFLTLFF